MTDCRRAPCAFGARFGVIISLSRALFSLIATTTVAPAFGKNKSQRSREHAMSPWTHHTHAGMGMLWGRLYDRIASSLHRRVGWKQTRLSPLPLFGRRARASDAQQQWLLPVSMRLPTEFFGIGSAVVVRRRHRTGQFCQLGHERLLPGEFSSMRHMPNSTWSRSLVRRMVWW